MDGRSGVNLQRKLIITGMSAMLVLAVLGTFIFAVFYDLQHQIEERNITIIPGHRDDRGLWIRRHYLRYNSYELDGHPGYIVHMIPECIPGCTSIQCIPTHDNKWVSIDLAVPQYFEYFRNGVYVGTFIPARQDQGVSRWQN